MQICMNSYKVILLFDAYDFLKLTFIFNYSSTEQSCELYFHILCTQMHYYSTSFVSSLLS